MRFLSQSLNFVTILSYSSYSCYLNQWAGLCSNKPLFTDSEIWTLHHCKGSWYIPSQVVLVVKNPPVNAGNTGVQSLSWKINLQPTGLQRVGQIEMTYHTFEISFLIFCQPLKNVEIILSLKVSLLISGAGLTFMLNSTGFSLKIAPYSLSSVTSLTIWPSSNICLHIYVSIIFSL